MCICAFLCNMCLSIWMLPYTNYGTIRYHMMTPCASKRESWIVGWCWMIRGQLLRKGHIPWYYKFRYKHGYGNGEIFIEAWRGHVQNVRIESNDLRSRGLAAVEKDIWSEGGSVASENWTGTFFCDLGWGLTCLLFFSDLVQHPPSDGIDMCLTAVGRMDMLLSPILGFPVSCLFLFGCLQIWNLWFKQ